MDAGTSPEPDQTQPGPNIRLSGYDRSEIRYVGMLLQSHPLRSSIKQADGVRASVLDAKPLHILVEENITAWEQSEARGFRAVPIQNGSPVRGA